MPLRLHWPAHGFLRKPGTIIVEFLPAIDPGLPKDQFMTQLETAIETASDALLPQTGADTTQDTAA